MRKAGGPERDSPAVSKVDIVSPRPPLKKPQVFQGKAERRNVRERPFEKRRRELSEARDAVVRQTNPNPNS